MFPFLELENSIMSTVQPTGDQRGNTKRHNSCESMTPREQLLGMLLVLCVLLLAIMLRSL